MDTSESTFVDSRDFARIARAIRYIDSRFREQPKLADIASHAGLSEFHFNRLFRRWAGVTPKQYLAFVTGNAAKGALLSQPSVLDARLLGRPVGTRPPARSHRDTRGNDTGRTETAGARHSDPLWIQRYAVRARVVGDDRPRHLSSVIR